ncbi:MAG: ABC transporter permease [Verrucomicrobiales bacterium]|jgi:lipoprotein-releasing system permease protein|nr:ABC transporter permease [Verrucomicrobiales bacterium]
MLFSPFIAARYLKPKRTFVSIITVISILGVALGVWLLAVVIAVFTGYGERIKDSILGFEPHMIVDSGGIIPDFLPVYEQVKETEGIISVTPYVRGQVVMDFQGLRSAPVIRGILPPEGDELERMRSKMSVVPDKLFPDDRSKDMVQGDFDLTSYYNAVIGDGMAEAQGIEVGDKLLLYSPRDIDSIMKALDKAEASDDKEDRNKGLEEVREMTAPQEVTVTGIFDSGHWDFDANIIFLHLETAQVLYNFDLEECHGLAVRTDDGFKADLYQKTLYDKLPDQYRVLTWTQMHKMIFDAVAAERQAMYLILFMIMIVGGFCIMNTMITVTFQKRSEIGLMKALGAREGQVAWIFLFQGVLVGLVGVFVGHGMAFLTIRQRNNLARWVGENFGVDIFAAEVYKVDGGLPAIQTLQDTVIISVGAFIACTIASLIPAVIAASLQPAKALRSE